MPNRTLGAELAQRLRKLRGRMRQVDAAERSGISQPTIARFETGRQVPRPEQVEALCNTYGAPTAEFRALAAIAQELREGTPRVVMHRDYGAVQADIRKRITEAALVQGFYPSGLPGLLQSPDYVQALFSTNGKISPEEAAGAAERLEAQKALADDTGRRFVLLMPEGSLGWALLPPEGMAAQVEYIAAVSRRRHIRIGIIPWGRVAPVIPLHSWEMYDRETVYFGTTAGSYRLNGRADVAAYVDLFAELERLAVFDEEARGILVKVAERYRRGEN